MSDDETYMYNDSDGRVGLRRSLDAELSSLVVGALRGSGDAAVLLLRVENPRHTRIISERRGGLP